MSKLQDLKKLEIIKVAENDDLKEYYIEITDEYKKVYE